MTSVAIPATSARIRFAVVLPATAILVATLVAWWASDPYVVGVFHDDGVYALLAKSIATGRGFHYIGLPGAPAAIHYPPAYPLLLGAMWWLAPNFPDNLGALLGLNAILVGVTAYGLLRFAVARLGWRAELAALFALAATISVPMLALSSALLSESLFLAALFPVLLVSERASEEQGTRMSIVAGASIGALMLVRTHAIALLVALLIVLASRRRLRDAALVAGAAIVIMIPWQLWSTFAAPVPEPLRGAYGSYVGWFATGLREGGIAFVRATMSTNLRECWLLLQDRVLPGSGALLRLPAMLTLLALLVRGGMVLWQRARTSILFAACYLAIVLVWPYAPWRFVWGIWPLMLLTIAAGAHAFVVVPRDHRARALSAAVIVLPVFTMLRTDAIAYESRSWNEPARNAGAQIAPVIQWTGRFTAPTDVVMAEGEQVISLFTGRHAAPTTRFTAREYVMPRDAAASLAALREMMATIPAHYVLPLAPEVERAAQTLDRSHEGLRVKTRLAHSTVYEVVRD